MKYFYITLLLFYIFSFKVAAQSRYISRVYDLVNGGEYGYRLVKTQKGYSISTSGVCIDREKSITHSCFALLSVDSSMNIVKNKVFKDWFHPANGRCLKYIGDTLYHIGENRDFNWKVMKFDYKGDSLGAFVFDKWDHKSLYSSTGIEEMDNYLYLYGRTYHGFEAEYEQIVVVKTDKKGNKIKEERFFDISKPDDLSITWDFIKTSDDNFAIAFWSLYPQDDEHNWSFIIAKVIKFDKNLNVIWHKEFEDHTRINNNPDLAATKDGGMILGWGLYIPDILDELGDEYMKYNKYPPLVRRLDKDGNTVWTDTLWTYRLPDPPGPKKNITRLITARNGDIIGAGSYKDPKDYYGYAWLFRMDSTGKMLWEKLYYNVGFTWKDDFFGDVIEEKNGDLVCVGSGGWDGSWLLRVDSMGCFEPECGTLDTLQLVEVTSTLISDVEEITEIIDNRDYFNIFPNPVDNRLEIQIFVENTKGKVLIYDMNGTLVSSIDYDTGFEDTFYIDVSELNEAIYLLSVVDSNKNILKTRKILIVHSK